MSTREAALRRIFEATGVCGRLSPDQTRELIAHLEDAVASKVAAGTAEVEAIGQAFSELGALPRLAEQLSTKPGLLTTMSRFAALKGVALLAVFFFIQTFLTPKFVQLCQDSGLPVPSMTLYFMDGIAEGFLQAVGLLLVGLGLAQLLAKRKGWTRKAVARLQASALALYGVVVLLSSALAAGCLMGIAALLGILVP